MNKYTIVFNTNLLHLGQLTTKKKNRTLQENTTRGASKELISIWQKFATQYYVRYLPNNKYHGGVVVLLPLSLRLRLLHLSLALNSISTTLYFLFCNRLFKSLAFAQHKPIGYSSNRCTFHWKNRKSRLLPLYKNED